MKPYGGWRRASWADSSAPRKPMKRASPKWHAQLDRLKRSPKKSERREAKKEVEGEA